MVCEEQALNGRNDCPLSIRGKSWQYFLPWEFTSSPADNCGGKLFDGLESLILRPLLMGQKELVVGSESFSPNSNLKFNLGFEGFTTTACMDAFSDVKALKLQPSPIWYKQWKFSYTNNNSENHLLETLQGLPPATFCIDIAIFMALDRDFRSNIQSFNFNRISHLDSFSSNNFSVAFPKNWLNHGFFALDSYRWRQFVNLKSEINKFLSPSNNFSL